MLQCRPAGIPGLCSLPVTRLRTGPNHYARKSNIEVTNPHQLSEQLQEITIFVPNGIDDQLRFYRENLVDYLALTHLPAQESGYSMVGCCPGDSYGPVPATIQIPPYSDRASGTVFSFHHNEKTLSPFFVALFCYGDSENEDSVGMENDFIGVYNNINQQDPVGFYCGEFRSWLDAGRTGNLPSAADRSFRDGLEVWILEDGTFVHVSVSRDLEPAVHYVGCARILAGKSWELDILRFANWGSFQTYVTQ